MSLRHQQGVALIAAIFLIVIISAAVTVLSVLASRNSQAVSQSLLQSRAQQAANAGLEFSIQSIVNTGICPAITTITVPSYSDYVVEITCDSAQYNTSSDPVTLFTLESSAEFGNENNLDYVWAKTSATVEL